jgi:hypothetical protein
MSALSTSDVSFSSILTGSSNFVFFQGLIFMIRVCGSSVFFYSSKFNSSVQNSIADGIDVPTHTTIKKFMVSVAEPKFDGLSLLFAKDRSMIFRILDSIQQIISRW